MLVVAAMVAWTAFTVWAYADPARRTPLLLVADLAVALAAILVSPLVKGPDMNATIPGFWVIGALLAWAVQWRWQGGLVAAVLLCAADLAGARRGHPGQLRQRLPAPHRRPGRRASSRSRCG